MRRLAWEKESTPGVNTHNTSGIYRYTYSILVSIHAYRHFGWFYGPYHSVACTKYNISYLIAVLKQKTDVKNYCIIHHTCSY